MVYKVLRIVSLGGIVLIFAFYVLGDEELHTFTITDFEGCMVPSMYVEQWGAFTDGASGKASVTCLTDSLSSERGEVIRIDYHVPFSYSFSGFYMKWECPNFDPREWEYVTFYIRGDPSAFTRRIKVEVKIKGWGWKVSYFNSVTAEWQRVVLPLKDFKWPGSGPAGWWKTSEFVITFEHERVTRWKGTIYIDAVGFAKHLPPSEETAKANLPPKALFEADPEKPYSGEKVRFDATASQDPDGEIVKYEWDWESDGTYDFATTDPVTEHRFSIPNPCKVTLRVTDDKGATTTVTKTITVVERKPPKADFTFTPASPTILDTVHFTDHSYDPEGKIVSWHWDFGDGTSSSEQNPSHKYTEKKTYTVRLTVTDDDGLTATAEKEIAIVNVPPVAKFTPPKAIYTNVAATFNALTSYDPDGEIVKHEWDFDSDGVVDAEGQEVEWTFTEEGTYTVVLIVTDDSGATSREETEIQVEVGGGGGPA